MDAVFFAEGDEFYVYEGCERDGAEFSGVLAFADAGVGFGLLGTGLFLREDAMHGVAHLAVRTVEEDIERATVAEGGDAAMMEVGCLKGDGRGGEVRSRDEDVHIAGVADGGFIGARNPRGDRISADDGVRHTRFRLSGSGAEQAAADFFHRFAHAARA